MCSVGPGFVKVNEGLLLLKGGDNVARLMAPSSIGPSVATSSLTKHSQTDNIALI